MDNSNPSSSKELNILVRYVPRIVLSHYLGRPEALKSPATSSFTAVVALFDLSGFSALGSKLSEDEQDQLRNPLTGKTETFDLGDQKADNTKHPRSSLPSLLSLDGDKKKSLADETRFASDRELGATNNNNTEQQKNASDDIQLHQRNSNAGSIEINRRGSTQHRRSFSSSMKAAPQGIAVEMLTSTLNQTLEPVIDVILRHNGDIIKFAGDAMIVLWETEASVGEETSEGLLTYCAVKCALEALQILSPPELHRDDSTKLGMHIGIGVSKVTGNHVGGVLNRWEFYLGGDANRQMSSAESDAASGQVVLSPEAYEAMTKCEELQNLQVLAGRKPTGNYIITSVSNCVYRQKTQSMLRPTKEIIPFIRSYVPGAISLFLQKGLALNSCVRNITAVFVKLEGVLEIIDPKEQLAKVQESLCVIQESAYKVQGTLRQFLIDDKGAVAIIVVGLPPFYHEDNALRAVKLTCHLLEKGISAAIGMTTGNAFCGSVGSSARAEYALVGDIINLAARLMSKALPGEIICDETTRENTKDTVRYHEGTFIPIKGKATMVKVYRVQRDQMQAKLDPANMLDTSHGLPYGSDYILDFVPLFGQAMSRADRKNSSLNSSGGQDFDSLAPTPRGLLVTGEEGTGKTMLLRHVAGYNKRCFMGSGDSVDSAIDFHAWVGIIKEMVTRTIKVSRAQSPKHGSEGLEEFLVTAKAEEGFFAGILNETRAKQLTKRKTSLVDDLETEQNTMLNRQSSTGILGNGVVVSPSHDHAAPVHNRGHPNNSYTRSSSTGSIIPAIFAQLGLSVRNLGTNGPPSKNHLANYVGLGYDRISVVDYLVQYRRIPKSAFALLNDLFPYDKKFCSEYLLTLTSEEKVCILENILYNMVDVISESKPILLIFDNAQWMDASSWQLLLSVMDGVSSISLLMAARPQSYRVKNQGFFDQISKYSWMKAQELKRFTYQVTSLFLSQYFNIAIMESRLLDFVFARTEGNPSEIIKLMNFLNDTRHIAIDQMTGTVQILSELEDLDMQVPQYTRARVMSCIDSLDGLAQTTLKVISIHPEPVEEQMLHAILIHFFSSDTSSQNHGSGAGTNVADMQLRIPTLTFSPVELLAQVRNGLVQCEKGEILKVDEQTKVIAFSTEEMRLVVYDTMLPSQREMIHSLYACWYTEITHPKPASVVQELTAAAAAAARELDRKSPSNSRNNSSSTVRLISQGRRPSSTGRRSDAFSEADPMILAAALATAAAAAANVGEATQCTHQHFGMLGFHYSRSGNLRGALEAYQQAAEMAIEAKDLEFATSCLHSDLKIMEEASKGVKKLSEVEYILLRSKIEFLRGAVAVQKSEWDEATSHMMYIIQLCRKRRNALRRASSPINKVVTSNSVSPARTTSYNQQHRGTASAYHRGSATSSMTMGGAGGKLPPFPPPGSTTDTDDTSSSCLPVAVMIPIHQCFPSLFGFRWFFSRSNPEESIEFVSQVLYYRRKAELLIKKIAKAKKKQEEMTKEIQKLTRQSLLRNKKKMSRELNKK